MQGGPRLSEQAWRTMSGGINGCKVAACQPQMARHPMSAEYVKAAGRLLVLGLETSCDETAAAVVERSASGAGRILFFALAIVVILMLVVFGFEFVR